ncbi:MAG: sialidase family protein [Terriglobia bacterium]|nr:sialidase family protein [Terriglobia bacterium]
MVKKLRFGQCSVLVLILSFLGGNLCFAGDTNSRTAPVITVGPNMLVSRDGDFPHMELSVASNPLSAKNLVGGAITTERDEGGFACKAYASADGGSTWVASAFPEEIEWGGGDPQVGFGLHGTAYFSALAFVKDDNGNMRGGLFFYRSEDGGKTWGKAANLGYSYDHEVLAVDHTVGRYAGRVYLSVLYGYPVYRLGVFRSDDDGRTFTGRVQAASGKGIVGINTVGNILLLSDGTLVLPYDDFQFDPAKRKTSHSGNIWLVTSSDGAVTFSEPLKVGTQEFQPDRNAPSLQTFAAAAVDRSEKYKDRIYVAWTDYREGAYRVVFTYSADRGKTWSMPKVVVNDGPTWSSQYQPEIAVSKQGVVGLTWFDTRNSTSHDDKQYDQYFAASLDGGESFSAPVRVSDKTSLRLGKGNLTMQPMFSESALYKGGPETRVSFISGVSRWPAGGDYMGLDVDNNGVFHPFWADARTGTYQIQTATVRVMTPEESQKGGLTNTSLAESGNAGERTAQATPTSLYGKVELVFDATSFDPATGVLNVPTRLRNVSSRPIHAPISLEVEKFGSGLNDSLKEFAPTILNSDNGKPGDGAVFDYSNVLGTEKVLQPGALSGQVVWHLKVKDPLRIPDLHISFSGVIPDTK